MNEQKLKTLMQGVLNGDQQAAQTMSELLKNKQIVQYIKRLAQSGDQLAQQFIQALQPKQAKNGAKLNYLKQLKGKCPEGYMKQGGRCEPCEARKGKKLNDPVVSFKELRKNKNKK